MTGIALFSEHLLAQLLRWFQMELRTTLRLKALFQLPPFASFTSHCRLSSVLKPSSGSPPTLVSKRIADYAPLSSLLPAPLVFAYSQHDLQAQFCSYAVF